MKFTTGEKKWIRKYESNIEKDIYLAIFFPCGRKKKFDVIVEEVESF